MGWPRKSKFRAKRTEVDGIMFASKKEAKRYVELKMLELDGEIRNLRLQVKFPIVVNEVKICTYITDFTYYTRHNDPIVEDVKGVRTPIYNLKKKLMLAVYGIKITET